jgi:hypothetical protein
MPPAEKLRGDQVSDIYDGAWDAGYEPEMALIAPENAGKHLDEIFPKTCDPAA